MKKSFIVLTLLLSILFAHTLLASDLAKEQRWREQVEDALLDGEPVTLNDGSQDFFAIYTPAAEKGKTAVIVLHGIGVHPDWPQVVNPLRMQLPEHGFSTLSLQLPVLPNEAESEEYKPLMKEVPPRIEAGIAYLKEAGYENIVIVAHSLGAQMSSYTLANGKPAVTAFAGIGMSPDNVQYLSAIELPVLDLYGEQDLEGVVKSAADRSKAAAGNAKYQQKMVPGANHFFEGHDDALLEAVTSWLKSL